MLGSLQIDATLASDHRLLRWPSRFETRRLAKENARSLGRHLAQQPRCASCPGVSVWDDGDAEAWRRRLGAA
ncbi:MAG: hypothetical protein WCF33_18710 [Pseudonocardiaceae bacterium]